MLRRVAVVDVGTNSIMYLLARNDRQKRIVPVHQEHHNGRLGRMVSKEGIIQEIPIREAITCLVSFKKLAEEHHADRLVAVGTHVFRKAENRKAVCERLDAETHLSLEILSERDEANWSYQGAVYARTMDGRRTVLDIGGGSTEIVQGSGVHISRYESLEFGAVSMTEKWIEHDPPHAVEMNRIESAVSAAWQHTFSTKENIFTPCIGVGGTVSTLAALTLGLDVYNSESIDGFWLDFTKLQNLIDFMAGMTLSQRKRFLPFDPERADIILAGSLILKVCMIQMECRRIFISDRGLRFGIALREFGAVPSS
jgi:exopolyphosphatase/guanosine-5'-triphosphate,3'-diphosphate pyrophosphatase